MSPIRAAIRAADSDDTAASRFAPKKIAPSAAGSTPELDVEPVGHQALRDEPATERVDREEDRQLQHDPLRPAEPQAAADPVVDGLGAAAPRWRRRAARTPTAISEPDDRVADDDRPVGVDRRQPAVEERLAEQARAERPGRGRDVARRGCTRRTSRSGACPGRSALSAACSTARNGPTSLPVGEITPIVAGEDQQGHPAREGEHDPRHDHQERPGDQDPATAEPVGMGRQPQRDRACRRSASGSGRSRSSAGRGRRRRGTGRGRRPGTRSRTSAASASRTGRRPFRSRPRRLAMRPGSAARGGAVTSAESTGPTARPRRVCENAAGGPRRHDRAPSPTPRAMPAPVDRITRPDDHGDDHGHDDHAHGGGAARPDRRRARGARGCSVSLLGPSSSPRSCSRPATDAPG